ncbi:MAG: uncharacterized protein A8A55_1194 [Amphiamblys sp. WSBS2006]|nr:MAG: uncharacterized protein A8A55_1194 [Amphiamblys sp. WSBS2006]
MGGDAAGSVSGLIEAGSLRRIEKAVAEAYGKCPSGADAKIGLFVLYSSVLVEEVCGLVEAMHSGVCGQSLCGRRLVDGEAFEALKQKCTVGVNECLKLDGL